MSHSIDKGPTLLILLLVAFAISGVGVALDGKVVPPASDTQTLIDDTVAQSVLSRRKAEASPAEPSDVARQLRRAVDAANRSDVESTDRLEARVTASEAKMEELNGLLEDRRSGVGLTTPSSERTKQFDHQLGELNARLEKLRPSNQ